MTPKERAEELLDAMSKQTYEYQPYAGATYIEEEVGYEAGKKCALICVDLILNGSRLFYTEDYDYWKKVKQEIKQL